MEQYVRFIVLAFFVATVSAYDRDICCGIDVTYFPRLDRSQVDGRYHLQRFLDTTSGQKAESEELILIFQDQLKTEFSLTRGSKPGRCATAGFKNVQRQNATSGPYSPCVISERIFPTPREPSDIIYLMPTDNLFLFYRCTARSSDRTCTNVLAAVLTKKRTITRRELAKADGILQQYFDLNINDLDVVNPSSLRCRLPEEKRSEKEQNSNRQCRPQRKYSQRRNYRRY